MLGKALKLLVVERIVYLVEEHSLLPKIYFRARKQRLIIYALLYLYKDIFRV